MNQVLKILTIDFPSAVKADFDESLKDSLRSCSVDHHKSSGKFNFSQDFDIVFLYIDGVRDPQRKISHIRSKLPLSEIIIVTNTDSFELALFSLRNGVRDIVSFPFEKEELNLSLKTAYSYRFAYFQSKKFSKVRGINNTFGDLREFKNFDDLFFRVKKMLSGLSEEVEFSIIGNIKGKEGNPDEYKIIFDDWNGQKNLDYYKKIKEQYSDVDRYRYFEQSFCHEFADIEGTHYIFFLSNIKKDSFFEDDSIREYFFNVLGNSLEYVVNKLKKNEMHSLAHTDDVTGLYNQRKLYKDIDKNIKVAKLKNESFSLVFLDLDNFKNVNDGHGHLVGTNLLLQVAQVIRQVIRDTDYIYRYGGDEFVIILPTAKAENAKKIGERLLSMIKAHDFQAEGGKSFRLSTSIGIAEFPRDAQDRKSILAIADKMMYEAKKSGRGRVCLIDEIFNDADKSNILDSKTRSSG